MKPKTELITIGDNLTLIKKFVTQIIVNPRQDLRRWSEITNQTPAAKIGYIGQHLASLITGVKGTRSGARGNDLADGSEVKSCNKVDQVDKCKDCGSRVSRFENVCPNCGGTNIDRKDDSKWLIGVRNEHELNQYLNMDRIVFILLDYPEFSEGDFSSIRITAFEIYPKETRCKCFRQLVENHYYNIFLPKQRANKNTNPMDFHPWSFQFFKCNPVQIFECFVKDVDVNPRVLINQSKYVRPLVDRSTIASVQMPTWLLRPKEWKELLEHSNFKIEIAPFLTEDYKGISRYGFGKLDNIEKQKALPFLNQKQRGKISLRKITSSTQTDVYRRM